MNKMFLLFRTRNIAEANIIKGMLEENGVPAFVMNKQDSSYLNFGDIEIYVPGEHKERAQQLLADADMDG